MRPYVGMGQKFHTTITEAIAEEYVLFYLMMEAVLQMAVVCLAIKYIIISYGCTLIELHYLHDLRFIAPFCPYLQVFGKHAQVRMK